MTHSIPIGNPLPVGVESEWITSHSSCLCLDSSKKYPTWFSYYPLRLNLDCLVFLDLLASYLTSPFPHSLTCVFWDCLPNTLPLVVSRSHFGGTQFKIYNNFSCSTPFGPYTFHWSYCLSSVPHCILSRSGFFSYSD